MRSLHTSPSDTNRCDSAQRKAFLSTVARVCLAHQQQAVAAIFKVARKHSSSLQLRGGIEDLVVASVNPVRPKRAVGNRIRTMGTPICTPASMTAMLESKFKHPLSHTHTHPFTHEARCECRGPGALLAGTPRPLTSLLAVSPFPSRPCCDVAPDFCWPRCDVGRTPPVWTRLASFIPFFLRTLAKSTAASCIVVHVLPLR